MTLEEDTHAAVDDIESESVLFRFSLEKLVERDALTILEEVFKDDTDSILLRRKPESKESVAQR